MKKFVLLLTAFAFAFSGAFAARMFPTTGRVVDEKGEAVAYATVVLLKEGQQVTGMSSDAEGRFELKVPTGEYTLSVQYLGFDPVKQPVRVEQHNDLGDIVLRTASTAIEGVVVKAQLIRREADRFVVDVANSPIAANKDGIELLQSAPGVWMDNDKISINGKSGSKVFINDRELRMEPEQLVSYLRSLRAEEIQKIEVIPVTGADQDADAAGGIIKITLRKRRENGIEGSVSMQTDQSSLTHTYTPGGNISFHSGKLDINASAWGYLGNWTMLSNERTAYTAADKKLRASSSMDEHDYSGGATLGAIYEFSDRHSIGAEFSYYHGSEETDNDTFTDLVADATTHTKSRYIGWNRANGYEGTFNYIWKIDTLGSTLKVLADYARRSTGIGNDNTSRITGPSTVVDSIYRDNTRSSYDVAALTLAFDKKFSPRWSLQAGAKYTRNDMRNDALYEFRRGEEWVRNDNQSFVINYTENIAAAYGIVSANLGRLSLVAGLRGEYTHAEGKGEEMTQDYFSLFPNANVSYALTKDGAYSLIAQYARTISRPRFWTLTPRRMQISDYTYQVGNPELSPAYKHDVSLTLVLKHKYTLTAGVTIQKDEIQQTMQADADNPDRLCIAWVNFDKTRNYYASANLPFQFTPWWQMNVNATYIRQGFRIDQHTAETFQNLFFAGASMTFTLPAKFYIDLSYRYQGRAQVGNVWVEPMHYLHAGLKKRFGERFTASFSIRNLLDQGQRIGARSEGFVRMVETRQPWCQRTYRIGLTYNFKAGKAFKHKRIEAGAAEDKGRL